MEINLAAGQLSLRTIHGDLVMEASGIQHLDVNELSTGIYLLQVAVDGENYFEKLVIE